SSDEDFRYVADHAVVGHLGLIAPSGFPRIVPLNFAAINNVVYFHGAKEGEKFDILKNTPQVSFSIDIPYSFIPSYFESKKSACPATHFFKSVHIRGTGLIVNDMEEKAAAMNELMKKYQPEGKYVKLSPKESMYKKPLLDVGVFKVDPKEITMKMKFGQNLSETKFKAVIESLEERGDKLDLATIEEMKKRYPSRNVTE
ncbi:MAG: flavin-nucleotide-binding protein, partial [Candidatus Heimdallarchaeota archaeon]|nr:flavin-nucleotide-binding protein [Candidatus Heimdallarchaeota archaeon]